MSSLETKFPLNLRALIKEQYQKEKASYKTNGIEYIFWKIPLCEFSWFFLFTCQKCYFSKKYHFSKKTFRYH